MTKGQKIIKILALLFAFSLIINIFAGIGKGILLTTKTFEGKKQNIKKNQKLEKVTSELAASDILTLKIKVKNTDLKIVVGETLKAESDDAKISCTQDKNKLIVEEKGKKNIIGKSKQVLVTIPKDIVLDLVTIETGAGEVSIADIHSKELFLSLGAGETKIRNLIVEDKAVFNSGVGEVELSNIKLHNLELNLGVGEIDVDGILTGKTQINGGIGEVNLDLADELENYRIKVHKGVGDIKINETAVKDNETYGNGKNIIEVHGGIGEVNIKTK